MPFASARSPDCWGRSGWVQRSEYEVLDLDSKVELIRELIPLGLMHIQELLDAEVTALAGPRLARDDGAPGMRYGSNPGSVRMAVSGH
jgi:hypothetical protein